MLGEAIYHNLLIIIQRVLTPRNPVPSVLVLAVAPFSPSQ